MQKIAIFHFLFSCIAPSLLATCGGPTCGVVAKMPPLEWPLKSVITAEDKKDAEDDEAEAKAKKKEEKQLEVLRKSTLKAEKEQLAAAKSAPALVAQEPKEVQIPVKTATPAVKEAEPAVVTIPTPSPAQTPQDAHIPVGQDQALESLDVGEQKTQNEALTIEEQAPADAINRQDLLMEDKIEEGSV